nr:PREDICTED: protein turtle homolog A-like [Latimeria chalumnae]|eukprot:XP_014343560.1 PREDICTED: protein turtle homolog A-like [Latimeria chalumnae]
MNCCFWAVCISLFFKGTLSTEGAVQEWKEPQAVTGRVGGSVVLGCDLVQQDEGRPPLYVIEWVRFGLLLPIFIKFGFYSPRVDAQYVDIC